MSLAAALIDEKQEEEEEEKVETKEDLEEEKKVGNIMWSRRIPLEGIAPSPPTLYLTN